MGCGCGRAASREEERSGLVKAHQVNVANLPQPTDTTEKAPTSDDQDKKSLQGDAPCVSQPTSVAQKEDAQGESVCKEPESKLVKVPGQFFIGDHVAVITAGSKAFGVIKAGPDDDHEYLVDWDNGDDSSYHTASDLFHESLVGDQTMEAPNVDSTKEAVASRGPALKVEKVPGLFTIGDRVAVVNAGSKAFGIIQAGPDDDGEYLVEWESGDLSTYHAGSDLIHESLAVADVGPSEEEELSECTREVEHKQAETRGESLQDKSSDDAPPAQIEDSKQPETKQQKEVAELSWEDLIARGDVQPSFSWAEAAAANQTKTLEWLLAAQEKPQELLESKDAEKQTALHVASKKGAVQACRFLIQQKANVLAQNKYRQIPLHLAAKEGHLEVVQLLLDLKEFTGKIGEDEESSPGLSSADLWRRTPLHKAAEGGRAAIFALMLERHANLSASDRECNTVLHFAINEGHSDIVKLVLQHPKGALILNVANKEDCSPLDLCIQGRSVSSGDDLVASGAKLVKDARKNLPSLHEAVRKGLPFLCTYLLQPSVISRLSSAQKMLAEADGDERTPVGLAAHMGFKDVLARLLNSQADLSCGQASGVQPLHEASRSGHVEVLAYLVEHGVAASNVDSDGQTVLFHASAGGHVETCLWLCKSDGMCQNLLECDHRERTALHAAAEAGQAATCECLLEQCKSDLKDFLNMEDWEGFTAAHLAVCAGHADVCHLLSRHHAQLYASLDFGASTLQSAAEQGHASVTRLLLDELRSGDTTEMSEALAVQRASDGRNAWLQSASQGHLECCQLLHPAYIDAKLANVCDRDKRNALMLAAQGGHKSTCEWLIKADIIPEALRASDACGWRTLHLAAAEGHENVVEWLLDVGADPAAVDEEGCSAAVWASRRGHLAIETLLKRIEPPGDWILRANDKETSNLSIAEEIKGTCKLDLTVKKFS